jgi:hypothetical protein
MQQFNLEHQIPTARVEIKSDFLGHSFIWILLLWLKKPNNKARVM